MTAQETTELLRHDDAYGYSDAAPPVKRQPSDAAGTDGISPRTWMLFSLLGGLIYGYNVSMAAPLQYVRDDLRLSSSHQELVSVTATLGDASSMLVGGWLADRFGRKATAMFACACSLFGAVTSSVLSLSFGWLVVWRLFTGIGNGLSLLLLPMYISECVDAQHRGTYLSLYQLGLSSGVAVPYLFMLFVHENWRSCLAFGGVPALLVLYTLYFHLPESTRWLRWKLNPDKYDLESDEGEAQDAQAELQDSDKPHHPYLELFLGIMLAHVYNSDDVSLFYGPVIISKAIRNYSLRDANAFGLLNSLLAAVAVSLSARFLINSLPRRQLYLSTLAVVVLMYLSCSVIFAVYAPDFAGNTTASAVVVVTLVLMNVFIVVGPCNLFVVILSELFTDASYRARYMSYCTFFMSFFSLISTGSMLTLFDTFGTAATFLGYGISYAVCWICFWWYLPETKHRVLV